VLRPDQEHEQRRAGDGQRRVERAARAQRVIELEKESEAKALAQIFIEAPYRNDAMLATLLEACRGDTLLCIAADLTLPREFVHTRTIGEWKSATPDLNRRPAVFVLYRESLQRAQKR
jgi:16S rRNA (cytidine1402-2'-O)-methyltransferase